MTAAIGTYKEEATTPPYFVRVNGDLNSVNGAVYRELAAV